MLLPSPHLIWPRRLRLWGNGIYGCCVIDFFNDASCPKRPTNSSTTLNF
ncbi:hypothetical protein DVH24_005716 [Malus domestica]|uniref:Uncharacterized protein n=1 Tax=Malus domestica TaxID=3750 RepID=A0A498IQF0_MALDO|nr:hypothetical protein DVH24_005716 [Malus domestica]